MLSELDYWISIDRAREKATGKQPKRTKAYAERPSRRRDYHISIPISKAEDEAKKLKIEFCHLCGVRFEHASRRRKYCDECRKRTERKRWHMRMQNPYFAARERIRQRLKNANRRKNGPNKRTEV